MKSVENLLLENKAWVAERMAVNPAYFSEMAKGQRPNFLWIGCADSRVPADELVGAKPGDLFVHRNIANLVIHTDLNVLSVVEYAVEQLKVENIIVCGHHGCGGVRAAMGNQSVGITNKWIRAIKDTYFVHKLELSSIASEEDRLNRLVELNTIRQAQNLIYTSIIQRAWKSGIDLKIHGWIYRMETGLIKPLILIDKSYELDPIFRYDLK